MGVLNGARSGVVDEQGWDVVFEGASTDAMTLTVQAGGDADGDGLGDLLVGAAPSADPAAYGHAWLLPGATLLQ